MRLALDATSLPPVAHATGPSVRVTEVPTGAGRYIVRLVQGLFHLLVDDRLFVFTKAEDVDRFGPWPSHAEPVPVRLPSRTVRLAWEQVGLPGWLRRLEIDLLHSPHYTMPLGPCRAARVVTFHDMGVFLLPEYLPAAKRGFFRAMARASARRADGILADSESTRADACRLLGIPDDRAAVVHLAADERFGPVEDPDRLSQVEAKYGLRHPFILSVGTLEPRKNLGAAVRTLARVRADGLDVQLAIVGARGWGYEPVFEEIGRLGLDEHVRVLGFVPEDDLPALYSACDVFVYPSIYEGFGLPPLEAMACGAAVIVSNRSSLPEIVGDGGLHYDPADEGTLLQMVRTVIHDREARRDWKRRAVGRAARFSWEGTARETYDSYRRAIAGRRG